jgi:riboflavin synthase
MFTGIVEETGSIESITPTKDGIRLVIAAKLVAEDLKLGDSLAINGVCLTLVKRAKKAGGALLYFDLLNETWTRTNLQFLKPGEAVNLERALAAGGRFGGHFVSGHVDGVGRIVKWERSGPDHVLDVEAPTDVRRYVVFKGSICVDGISLTVSGVTKKGFRLWIIPHTFEVTNLRSRKVGDAVNLEADLLGKYVDQLLERRLARPVRRKRAKSQ